MAAVVLIIWLFSNFGPPTKYVSASDVAI